METRESVYKSRAGFWGKTSLEVFSLHLELGRRDEIRVIKGACFGFLDSGLDRRREDLGGRGDEGLKGINGWVFAPQPIPFLRGVAVAERVFILFDALRPLGRKGDASVGLGDNESIGADLLSHFKAFGVLFHVRGPFSFLVFSLEDNLVGFDFDIRENTMHEYGSVNQRGMRVEGRGEHKQRGGVGHAS